MFERQGKVSGTTFQFENVTRTFGNHPALSAVSLRLESGQHTAILGASGCGKTTLLRLLAGLDPPSAGQVTMNGQPASVPGRVIIPPHRRRIAMVFQDLALWPNLHVIDNVGLALSGASLSRKEVSRRSTKALDRCRIADLAERKPGELSGGQQQRVALARAIAARPDFLLLDEPFAGLDLLTRDYILAQIRDLANTIAFTVVLVTHDPADAALLCSHAIVMEEARVAECGALPDLFQNAQSQLLRRFQQLQARLS
jgi:ABC-type Fe3+/spermidine/putrescine transport system ATPase subunit